MNQDVLRTYNQLEYYIGLKKNKDKRIEYRQKVRNIINSNLTDKEKEISLLSMLNAIEKAGDQQ